MYDIGTHFDLHPDGRIRVPVAQKKTSDAVRRWRSVGTRVIFPTAFQDAFRIPVMAL